MKELFNTMPQIGKVELVTIRTKRKGIVEVVEQAMAKTEHGLEGDHYKKKDGKRQVTLIQSEHLDAIASILGKESIDPTLTRRNIVVRGINIHALKEQKIQIGEAILEGTGDCHPCSRMEANFGDGGYNAMRGHGGLTARVIKNGLIKTGDEVKLIVEITNE